MVPVPVAGAPVAFVMSMPVFAGRVVPFAATAGPSCVALVPAAALITDAGTLPAWHGVVGP